MERRIRARTEQNPGQKSQVSGARILVGMVVSGRIFTTYLTERLSVQSVRPVLAEMQDLQTRLAALDIVVRQVSALLSVDQVPAQIPVRVSRRPWAWSGQPHECLSPVSASSGGCFDQHPY